MKEKILITVASLCEKYGLKKFTVDEVATELHISKKTIYRFFNSKEDMVQQYLNENFDSERDAITQVMNSKSDLCEKIHSVIYSNLSCRFPVQVLDDIKRFYPEEWKKFEEIKQLKVDALQKFLEKASEDGLVREDLHFGIISILFERVGDLFLDTDFLLKNKLTASEVIDEALHIVIRGILKQNHNEIQE